MGVRTVFSLCLFAKEPRAGVCSEGAKLHMQCMILSSVYKKGGSTQ